jgi:small subunit ribosomal protein S11
MGSSRRSASKTATAPASKIFKQEAGATANTQKYYLHCLTSHSNTLLTLTNYKHEPVLWTSGGLCGFKKAARGGYEAGFRSTITMLEKMQRKEAEDQALLLKERTEPTRVQKTAAKKRKAPFKPREIELVIKEFGLGREAVMKALAGQEGDYYRGIITKVIDATPLKFGGVRARAVRRL